MQFNSEPTAVAVGFGINPEKPPLNPTSKFTTTTYGVLVGDQRLFVFLQIVMHSA
jgi:hypothetical protein